MSLQWVPENKRALGFQGETIAVASQAILDEPLRLKNAIRIPPPQKHCYGPRLL